MQPVCAHAVGTCAACCGMRGAMGVSACTMVGLCAHVCVWVCLCMHVCMSACHFSVCVQACTRMPVDMYSLVYTQLSALSMRHALCSTPLPVATQDVSVTLMCHSCEGSGGEESGTARPGRGQIQRTSASCFCPAASRGSSVFSCPSHSQHYKHHLGKGSEQWLRHQRTWVQSCLCSCATLSSCFPAPQLHPQNVDRFPSRTTARYE